MTNSPPETEVNEAQLREASRWVALRALGDEADEADFIQWLEKDPQHRIAYDAVARQLGDPAILDAMRWAAREESAPPRWRLGMSASKIAAGISILALVGGIVWRPLWERALAPVMEIASEADHGRDVTLPEGSSLSLDGNSQVRVQMGATERRVTLSRGEAYFDVAHDADRPFEVLAGSAEIRVLGTAFDVNRSADGVELAVYRGRVKLMAFGTQLILTAGQRTTLSNGQMSAPTTFDPSAPDWRTGWLDTEGVTLANLVERLNRHSAHRISITDPRIAAIQVSGRFRLDNPQELLKSLGTMYGFKSTQQGDGLLLDF